MPSCCAFCSLVHTEKAWGRGNWEKGVEKVLTHCLLTKSRGDSVIAAQSIGPGQCTSSSNRYCQFDIVHSVEAYPMLSELVPLVSPWHSFHLWFDILEVVLTHLWYNGVT